MGNQLKEFIENNLIVFTRDLFRDYNYFCKSPFVDEKWYWSNNSFITIGEHIRDKNLKDGMSKTQWFQFSVENGKIFIRVVQEGMLDFQSRLIYRYEGVFLANNIQYNPADPSFYTMIEQALDKAQQKLQYGKQKQEEPKDDKTLKAKPQTLELIGQIYKDGFGNLWVMKEQKCYRLVDLAGNHLSESRALKPVENSTGYQAKKH